jgi:hypothetical protein
MPSRRAFLEKLNPCFHERHVESEGPNQLLSGDTFMVGTLKGIGPGLSADRRGADRQCREFCGSDRHPYELYLALNDIEDRKTRVGSPRTNGFVERFNGTILEEFFRPAMRSQLYESVEALQADLDAWLVHYNHERPHLGYRNQGRRPWNTVEPFVSQSSARQGS